MSDVIKRESVYLWYYFSVQFEQIAPYWILGMVLGSVVSVFGKKEFTVLWLYWETAAWESLE